MSTHQSPQKTTALTIRFSQIDSEINLKKLADELQGDWDGRELHVDSAQIKLNVKSYKYMDDIFVELCEMETINVCHFFHAPKIDSEYIFVRVGFSGVILNLEGGNDFDSNGIFMYSSNQQFEIEYPAGVKARWLTIKYPRRLYNMFGLDKDFGLKEQMTRDNIPWIYYFPLDHEVEEYVKTMFMAGKTGNGRYSTPFSRSIDILGAIKEKFQLDAAEGTPDRIHPDDFNKIITIKNQILLRMDRAPRLEELSMEHGMSVSKLNRLFKSIFKHPVLKFYNLQKIEEVRRKVQHSADTLSDIAEDMGFSHVAHMSRVFKKHYGYPPSDLRKINTF